MTQAVILCGGKGTRLSALYSDRPKILVPIAGRPFLEWQLEWLGRNGITDIHLAAGHKADVLREWLESNNQAPECASRQKNPDSTSARRPVRITLRGSPGVFQISFSTEPAPLGTGGGLRFVDPWVRGDPFFVMNGDSLSPYLDFEAMLAAHRREGATGPSRRSVTIAVTRINEAGRYGTVEFDAGGRVTAFREKAQREAGCVNAGVYLVSRSVLASIPPERSVSLETDVFPGLVQAGLVGACPAEPPMLDMGTPDGIAAMEAFLKRQRTEN